MAGDDNEIETVDAGTQDMTQNDIATDRHKMLTKKILESKQIVTTNISIDSAYNQNDQCVRGHKYKT